MERFELLKAPFMAVAMLIGTAGFAQSAEVATFDWEVVTGNWWDTANYNYTLTDGSVDLVASGRASRASNAGNGGGSGALKAAYSQDADPALFNAQVGGVATNFIVNSIDISANAGSGAEISPLVSGFLGGVQQWEIDPTLGVYATYTTSTTGDMSLAIDQIVWNTGVHSDPNNTFGNSLDNLMITTAAVPEPSSLGLAVLGPLALLRRRRSKR